MTLPQGFRPATDIIVCGTMIGGQLQSANNTLFYTIAQNGQVRTYTYSALNGGRLFATFIIP